MNKSTYPTLYQVNIRVLLTELSRSLGRPTTLDDVPDALIGEWANLGFDCVWLLSVWQTGNASRSISRTHLGLRREFENTLSDLTDADIEGSGFAIQSYVVHPNMGGNTALARLRSRLQQHDLKLMLDFVPNHVALDHPWTNKHPDFIVQGTADERMRDPNSFTQVSTANGSKVFAMGRDPYFPAWTDTLQLNYGNPALQDAMIVELERIAEQCDAVRCDMAMLIEPEIFERTWGIKIEPFWPTAIRQIQSKHPKFVFLAEVYWDMEWQLLEHGFHYCYDKRLYDRLRDGNALAVSQHLSSDLNFQSRMARFLENHDEPRAASAFDIPKHKAAAVLTYLAPGVRFFHDGQFTGRTKKLSPHLVRRPSEPNNGILESFYNRLLRVIRDPILYDGALSLPHATASWQSNETFHNIIAFHWRSTDGSKVVVVVNYSMVPSQAYIHLKIEYETQGIIRFKDLLTEEVFDRDTEKLREDGLYVDLQPWGIHLWRG